MLQENEIKTNIFQSLQMDRKWEAFVVGKMEIGQVSWLRQIQSDGFFAGFWKHKPRDHPDGMPYGVQGNEAFYVLEGEAEITTVNGEKIVLKAGNSYSFTDGFKGTWKTKKYFVKFFVVS